MIQLSKVASLTASWSAAAFTPTDLQFKSSIGIDPNRGKKERKRYTRVGLNAHK